MRWTLAAIVALVVTLLALPAAANGVGIAGYSGKQGKSCSSCHSGGTAPTVTLTGPASLAPGGLGDYTLRITTTAKKAGGCVAGTDGVTLTAGAGLTKSGVELVNSAAVTPNAGEAALTFRVTAPKTGTSFTLFAAGVGGDGAGASGDGVALATKEIMLNGVSAPVTPDPPKPPPKAAATAKDAGSGADEDEEEEEEEEDRPRRPRPVPEPPGCMATRGSVDSPAALTFLVLLALRRRRR